MKSNTSTSQKIGWVVFTIGGVYMLGLGLVVFVVGGARGQSVWQRCLFRVVGLSLGAIRTAGSIHRRHRGSP